MKTRTILSRRIATLALLIVVVGGCKKPGRDPIFDLDGTVTAVDTTLPRVTSTQPATNTPPTTPTPGVPANSSISAVFTEEMIASTITAPGTFTLSCSPACAAPTPAGTVTYTAGALTATFKPTAALEVAKTYTATITTAAKDLAGNPLAGNQAPLPAASNYVWKFNTVAAAPPAPVTVSSTNPAAGAGAVCPGATINATFSTSGFRMDPTTVNSTNFTLTGPGLTAVNAQSIVLDSASGRIATFTPMVNMTSGVLYTATIKGGASGVKDLGANQMAANKVWTFTVGPANACTAQAQPAVLMSAAPFGTIGGTAGMTNQGTLTVVNGDIGTTGASTTVTGFHDAGPGCTYTETGANVGTVNGKIYTAAPPPTVACPTEGTAQTFQIAQQARLDAMAAYNYLAGLAGTCAPPCAANLAGVTLFPGVYRSATGFLIQNGSVSSTGDLTLDGQGDANAVWVFQSASTLTVGGPGAAFPRSVKLINGAQSKNVFWQVGSSATINAGGGGTMEGTIIAQNAISFSTVGNVTVVTLNGRTLSLGAGVTVVNTVINVPAP